MLAIALVSTAKCLATTLFVMLKNVHYPDLLFDNLLALPNINK
jgi:hypothetical protein